MKLLKENGMIDKEVLEGLCWQLTMIDLKIKPTKDGVWLVDPADWRDNVSNIKLLKQILWYVNDNTRTKQHYRNKKDSLEEQLETAYFNIKQLTKEKEDINMENSKLKEKIQEAQVTAGLFIQSVKDKLPSWFSKEK